jgi:DNA-binding NarL/FixJ family response regulator
MGDARGGEAGHPAEATTSAVAIRMILVGARLFAEALAASLQADDSITVIGAYTDPVLAIDAVRATKPDIVVLDDTTTQLDVTRLVNVLRPSHAESRIVVLSLAANEPTLTRYARAGAAGCFAIDRSLTELIASLKHVGSGGLLFEADQLVELLAHPEGTRPASLLAPRELEVLQVLATGMSTEEAAAQLGISIHTLRTHLKKAMIKMNARSKIQLIVHALRAGLIRLPH